MAEYRARGGNSQVDRAYRQLKHRICAGLWQGGETRLEREAAAELGVSRTPVREALIRLEEERLVAVRPRHGFTVIPVSADDMAEIYEILTALEPVAAARLAGDGASDATLARLDAAISAMDAALEADDRQAWADADMEFHRALVEECGNARLAAIAATVRDQANRARIQTLHLRPTPMKSNDDHRALVAAIRAGDAETAYALHRRHRENAAVLIVSILRRSGLDEL